MEEVMKHAGLRSAYEDIDLKEKRAANVFEKRVGDNCIKVTEDLDKPGHWVAKKSGQQGYGATQVEAVRDLERKIKRQDDGYAWWQDHLASLQEKAESGEMLTRDEFSHYTILCHFWPLSTNRREVMTQCELGMLVTPELDRIEHRLTRSRWASWVMSESEGVPDVLPHLRQMIASRSINNAFKSRLSHLEPPFPLDLVAQVVKSPERFDNLGWQFLNYGADMPKIDQDLIEDTPPNYHDLLSSLWPFSDKRDLPEGILTQLYLDGKKAEKAIDQIVFSKKKHDLVKI